MPLSPAALVVVLRRLDAAPGQHLFPVGGSRAGEDAAAGWSGRFRDWLKLRVARALAAKRRRDHVPAEPMPAWKIHGLRHALATHLREDLSVSGDIVSLILGHTIAGPRITRTYDRADRLPERRRALEAWARWLGGLASGPGESNVVQFTAMAPGPFA